MGKLLLISLASGSKRKFKPNYGQLQYILILVLIVKQPQQKIGLKDFDAYNRLTSKRISRCGTVYYIAERCNTT